MGVVEMIQALQVQADLMEGVAEVMKLVLQRELMVPPLAVQEVILHIILLQDNYFQ